MLLLICSQQVCPAIRYCLDKLESTAAASSACLQIGCWKAYFHSSIIPSPTELYFLTLPMLETSCLTVVQMNCEVQDGSEGIALCLGEKKQPTVFPL